jgi:hypothetical protein
LAQAARAEGIAVGRSQVRRILLAEGQAGDRPARGRPAPTRSSPQRAKVIACDTSPPPATTVSCADELGPVLPRSFPPAPGWPPTATGSSRAGLRPRPGQDLGYGALRVADGQVVTLTAPSRNSVGDQGLLAAVEAANPAGTIVVITDNLSSHSSVATRAWLADHARIQPTFIPRAPAG